MMGNRLIISIIALLLTTIFCNAQKNEIDYNIEKYDFKLMKRFTANGASDTVIKRGDTLIQIHSMSETGTFSNEYPVAPNMYQIQKIFYPNGNMKSIKKYVGENLSVGQSKYYDDIGNLVEIVDEDRKFGSIKLNWILNFLDKEGFIDLRTGRGREELEILENGRGSIKASTFSLKFFTKEEFPKYKDYSVWIITIKPSSENDNYRTIYFINGDTDEILDKQRERVLYKE